MECDGYKFQNRLWTFFTWKVVIIAGGRGGTYRSVDALRKTPTETELSLLVPLVLLNLSCARVGLLRSVDFSEALLTLPSAPFCLVLALAYDLPPC